MGRKAGQRLSERCSVTTCEQDSEGKKQGTADEQLVPASDATSPREEPAAAEAGLTEHLIDQQKASAMDSLSQSVGMGYSVLVVPSMANAEECDTLLCAGASLARDTAISVSTEPQSNPGWRRFPVAERFSELHQELCDTVLMRVLEWVQTELPELWNGFFGDGDIESCLANPRLTFARGEPAVNIYTTGGCFRPHEDHESLTILVPLSDPEAFEGGGTAYWPCDPAPTAGAAGGNDMSPSFVLKPIAGSAILFGGTVWHAGQPVVTGERGVFVASLSLASEGERREHVSNGTTLGQMRAECEEEAELWKNACLEFEDSDDDFYD